MKNINNKLKIILTLILFTVMIIGGLIIADNSFNSMLGKKQDNSIFTIKEKSENVYDINIMGKEKELNTNNLNSSFLRVKEAVYDIGEKAKESISAFNLH